MTADEAFLKFTTYKKTKTFHSVKCKKSLWSVFANTKELALAEAKYCFMQYFEDGEYDEKIKCYDNGGSTADRYTVVFMDRP